MTHQNLLLDWNVRDPFGVNPWYITYITRKVKSYKSTLKHIDTSTTHNQIAKESDRTDQSHSLLDTGKFY